jgi:hypothetical protein
VQFEPPPVARREEAPSYEQPAPRYEQPAAYEAPAEEEAAPAYQPPPPAPAPVSAPSVRDDDEERPNRTPLYIMAGVIVLLLAVVGFMFTRGGSSGGDSGALKAGEGELVVTTRTPGAQVKVDGKDAGVTPATIRLQSGPHTIEVQAGKGEPRVVPVMIRAGATTAQYVEIPDAPPISPPKAPAEKGKKR